MIQRYYLYQISTRRTAFAKPLVWWVREPLDVDAMRRAAAAFVGRQDFAALSDDDPAEKSTVVVLEAIEIVEHGALILIRVRGSHFLWKMVRRIVGVLAAVGRGEIDAGDAGRFLESDKRGPGGKTAAAMTAPAAGLFLEYVRYKGDPDIGPIVPVTEIR